MACAGRTVVGIYAADYGEQPSFDVGFGSCLADAFIR